MGALADEPMLDTFRPFTRSEALAAGMTDADLRGKAYQRILHRIYLSADVRMNDRHRAAAALMVVTSPHAHLSHLSAARLHGLPVPGGAEEHVSVPTAGERRRAQGLRCHVAPPGSTTVVDGLHVSSCERTFCELAARLDLVQLVVVGDHLLRHRMTTSRALADVLSGSPLPHRRRALAAHRLMRQGVESPLESRVRMLLSLAGIPSPLINLEICTDGGTVIRRHDLAFPESKVAVECDGRGHVDVRANWISDIRRDEETANDGWRVVRVVSRDLQREPAEVLRRVLKVLRAGGQPGLPRKPADDWRPYFRT